MSNEFLRDLEEASEEKADGFIVIEEPVLDLVEELFIEESDEDSKLDAMAMRKKARI